MANNFRKVVLFSTLAGVAAAGTYYLLQKKEAENKEADLIDEFDDFEDDEIEVKPKRAYVSIDLESAKEMVSENVLKAIDKTKELISDFNVPEKLDKAKTFVEGYSITNSKEAKADEPEYTTVYETSINQQESTEDFDDEDIESEDFDFTDEK